MKMNEKEEKFNLISDDEEHSDQALITLPILMSRQQSSTSQDVMSLAMSLPALRSAAPSTSSSLINFSLPSSWNHLGRAVSLMLSPNTRPIEDYTLSWQTKCSICFDRNCEFSFPKCQDQFCRECIRHFISEVIRHAAWGLAKVEVKCPVCHDILTKEVWSKYADSQTFEFYEHHMKLSKIVTRFCGVCGDELRVFDGIVTSLDAQRR